jgi:hypothetical protein
LDTELDMEMALAEVKVASDDLADFLIWFASQGDESDEVAEAQDFAKFVGYIYAYSLLRNAEKAGQAVRASGLS